MGRRSVHFVRLRIAGVCLGILALALTAGAPAWAQTDGLWSGRGEATGRGTEAELRARAIDNGRQRALANWLKVRLEPGFFAEYSKDLQRTLLVRAADFVLSETVTELERPSAQTLRLTVHAKFDEAALESSLRAGGFLRPWSGRKEILTYALRHTASGYAMAGTTGTEVDAILQRLAQQELQARRVPKAINNRLQAAGVQASQTYFAQALTSDNNVALHLVWLLSETTPSFIEAYTLISMRGTSPSLHGWTLWQSGAEGKSAQAELLASLSQRLNALDQPWENWLVLRSSLPGSDLLARAAKLADVPMFDEVSPVELIQRNQSSELSMHFYSLATTAEIEAQVRKRLNPVDLVWSLSRAGRPMATVDLGTPQLP